MSSGGSARRAPAMPAAASGPKRSIQRAISHSGSAANGASSIASRRPRSRWARRSTALTSARYFSRRNGAARATLLATAA
ncbi:MAG: hypothetical protein F4092_07345, partial [Rhodospirillaceae bacterium]|nr:hypothetical protein [Rhodospirillaceae bacterium]